MPSEVVTQWGVRCTDPVNGTHRFYWDEAGSQQEAEQRRSSYRNTWTPTVVKREVVYRTPIVVTMPNVNELDPLPMRGVVSMNRYPYLNPSSGIPSDRPTSLIQFRPRDGYVQSRDAYVTEFGH